MARLGKDRTVIALWRGLSLIQIIELRKKKIDETAAVIRELADFNKVKLSNVIADADGLGAGLVDVLKCREFRNGSRATKPERFINLKAECFLQVSFWLFTNTLIYYVPQKVRILLYKILIIFLYKNKMILSIYIQMYVFISLKKKYQILLVHIIFKLLSRNNLMNI